MPPTIHLGPRGPGDRLREILDAVGRRAQAVVDGAAELGDAMWSRVAAWTGRGGFGGRVAREIASGTRVAGRKLRSTVLRLGDAARSRVASRRGMAASPKWLRRIPAPSTAAVWSAAAGAWLVVALVWGTCGARGCPSPNRLIAYQPERAPVLLDRYGRAFARLMPVDRRVVPIDSLPDYVPAAFVAVEDRRFYEHRGVDLRRVVGAAIRDVRSGGYDEGASTITMQVARNLFPTRLSATDRSLRRKLLEARVALGIEERFSKREILELYLNHIYFGDGAWGIDAASREYFGQPASRLTLAQAATLAGLVRSPAGYDPRDHTARSKARRNLVLALMARQGRADSTATAKAAATSVHTVAHRTGGDAAFAAYYVDHVRKLLEASVGEGLYGRGLRVLTSLDPDAQRIAGDELRRQLGHIEEGRYGRLKAPRYGSADALGPDGTRYLQGAVAMLEPSTGDVLALVGGRDHGQSTFDRAVAGRRQVGSAFKPFVYAAALEQGYAPTQPILDGPFTVRLSRNRTWKPTNYEGDYEGLMTMRYALVHSRNVPTVRLATAVGLDPIVATAHAAGIRDSLPATPSLALGAASLTPLEMAAAYTPFANLGDRTRPRFVLAVADSTGRVLWRARSVREPALDPTVAWLTTDILRDVVDRGTATAVRAVGYDGPAAGKTGTTSDLRDAWFVGYTPDVVAAVWVGFDQPRRIMGGASGGRLAAPIWGRILRRYDDARDDAGGAGRYGRRAWTPPSDVAFRWIDPASGMTLADGCEPYDGSEPRQEAFARWAVPDEVCPMRAGMGGWLRGLWDRVFGEEREHREYGRVDLAPTTETGRILGARVLPGTAGTARQASIQPH